MMNVCGSCQERSQLYGRLPQEASKIRLLQSLPLVFSVLWIELVKRRRVAKAIDRGRGHAGVPP
jgi:hypothetical protein